MKTMSSIVSSLLIAAGALLPGCLGETDGSTAPSGMPHRAGDGDAGPVVLNEDFSSRQIFPPDNWWNLDVSQAPVDPKSAALIEWIGPTRRLHPDFGPPPYGIPYIGVAGDQPLLPIEFVLYGDESDPGAPGLPPGYPVPDEARTLPNYIEGASRAAATRATATCYSSIAITGSSSRPGRPSGTRRCSAGKRARAPRGT